MIRHIRPSDHVPFLAIARTIADAGDTYVFDERTTPKELEHYWINHGGETFIADEAGAIQGGYILKPNHQGRGSHIATASFIVSPGARGMGLGRALGEHAITRAREQGYRAMQFNMVVSANTNAIRLWQSLGFETVGTLPGAFRHTERGYTDAHVMFRTL